MLFVLQHNGHRSAQAKPKFLRPAPGRLVGSLRRPAEGIGQDAGCLPVGKKCFSMIHIRHLFRDVTAYEGTSTFMTPEGDAKNPNRLFPVGIFYVVPSRSSITSVSGKKTK